MRHIFTTILLAIVLTIMSPLTAKADSGITIISSDAEAMFPTSIEFSLEAEATSDIVSIQLEYRAVWQSIVPVDCRVQPDFIPGDRVEAIWKWDMLETGGLPTGTVIEYRWLICDVAGNELETDPCAIRFEDLRYDWQSMSQGQMTFYWYEGDDSFVQDLVAAASDALENLSNDLGVSPENDILFYIYASSWELRGALVYPDEWTGGMAFPDYNTIVIGISPSNLDWGQRAIAHELGHMVVHQTISGPFGYLPLWLDEGLAMSAEGELRLDLQSALEEAIDRDALFSVRSITGSFPANAEQAKLCYAESYSVVQFLRDSFGSQKLLELLSLFADGSASDQALLEIYGFDTEGLNRLWRESLGLGAEQPGYPDMDNIGDGIAWPYFLLLAVVLILGIMIVYLCYLYYRRIR